MLFDFSGLVQKLTGGETDLGKIASTFGLNHKAVTSSEEMSSAFVETAKAAELALTPSNGSGAKVEVVYVTGAPVLMKGRKVRILAVLGDFED